MLIDSVIFRLFWLRHGVTFLRGRDFTIRSIRIDGTRIPLSVPPGEEEVISYELKNILYDDCYGLRTLGDKVETIVDIGGNVGLFSMAARVAFPHARIQSYEPHPATFSHHARNTGRLGIKGFQEAVGLKSGLVDMIEGNGSLHSTTKSTDSGQIQKISASDLLARAGGSIDLLKLDCEGAEWELFEDVELWKHVRHVTMEYHLWASAGSSPEDLFRIMSHLGFRLTHFRQSEKLQWGILWATNKALSS